MDNRLAVDEMNWERLRCGSPPLERDARLDAMARVRLVQLPENGYSDVLNDGSDPLPPLAKQYDFPGPVTQGSVVGGCEPAGLAVRDEADAEPLFVPPARTHHGDLINPRWNRVGFASGIDPYGIPCSVVIYGREEGTDPGERPVAVGKGHPDEGLGLRGSHDDRRE